MLQLETLLEPYPPRLVSGKALHLLEPISFWGGVSPDTAQLTDPRSPLTGVSIANRVLFIRELRGSSSASSVLLELAYARIAPAAIVLTAVDAILALGAIVAAEMQWATPGIYRCDALQQATIPDDAWVSIHDDATLTAERAAPRD